MVDEALKGNGDLLIAAARVDEARALLGEANSFFWPSIDAQAGVSRQQISTRTATSFPGIPREYSNHRATLNVSYELDLFGRLRAGVRRGAPRARGERGFARSGAPRARRAGRQVLLRAARARRAGIPDPKDGFPARGGARAAAQAPAGRRDLGVRAAPARGRGRGGARAAAAARARPRARGSGARGAARAHAAQRCSRTRSPSRPPSTRRPGAPVLPAGMPSELLLRRPDLVEAERVLAAANARVAQARAEMFPSISLTAFLGSESAALANLFSGGAAATWQIAAGLTQPIFAGRPPGGAARRRRRARARRARAVPAGDPQRVRRGAHRAHRAGAARAKATTPSRRAPPRSTRRLRLARLRYQNGVASQLDVIDAERGLLAGADRAHRSAARAPRRGGRPVPGARRLSRPSLRRQGPAPHPGVQVLEVVSASGNVAG